eukprot:s4733_g2.t3
MCGGVGTDGGDETVVVLFYCYQGLGAEGAAQLAEEFSLPYAAGFEGPMCKSETYVLDSSFDPAAFVADVKEAKAAVGDATEEDARHLQGLVLTSQVLLYGGHAMLLVGAALPHFSWLVLALGALMISFARCMKWTIIGHHVSHGGFDKLQKTHPNALPSHYKRGVFAIGIRRFIDWMDWMMPQVTDGMAVTSDTSLRIGQSRLWRLAFEGLRLDFGCGAQQGPSLLPILRNMPLPSALKYISMIMWVFTWKFTYYSPNTFKELMNSKRESWLAQNWPADDKKTDPVVVFDWVKRPLQALAFGNVKKAVFWMVFFVQWFGVITPMLATVALPALWPLLLGQAGLWPSSITADQAALRVLVTSVVADLLSNAHSFVIIACNHSGGDLYRYSTSCKAYSAEFLLRCTYSSANFETGNDLIDTVYGWLNYQVEHHMFPDMTPLQYRKLQPLVKSICKKHNVQYVQMNALRRTWMMFQVAVGDAEMKRCTALVPPQAYKDSVGAEGLQSTVMGG